MYSLHSTSGCDPCWPHMNRPVIYNSVFSWKTLPKSMLNYCHTDTVEWPSQIDRGLFRNSLWYWLYIMNKSLFSTRYETMISWKYIQNDTGLSNLRSWNTHQIYRHLSDRKFLHRVSEIMLTMNEEVLFVASINKLCDKQHIKWMKHLPPVWWPTFRFRFLTVSWCERLKWWRFIAFIQVFHIIQVLPIIFLSNWFTLK